MTGAAYGLLSVALLAPPLAVGVIGENEKVSLGRAWRTICVVFN